MKKSLRQAILQSFKQPEVHPRAEDILKTVREKIQDLAEEDFFAQLEELEEQGEINSILHIDKQKHYHTRQDLHFHFICEKCGVVRDVVIEKGAINMIKDHVQVLANSYARIDTVNMSFLGVCHECQKK